MDVESLVQKALRDGKQLVPGALVQLHDSQVLAACEVRLFPSWAPSAPAFVVSQTLLQTFEVEPRRFGARAGRDGRSASEDRPTVLCGNDRSHVVTLISRRR